MAVKVYAFVNDTSFFNKGGDGTYEKIDQGACCASQKIVNMFAEPATIADSRSARLKTQQLYVVSSDVTGEASKLKAANTFLGGKMSLMYDKKQYENSTLQVLNDATLMGHVFDFIELLGNYQRVVADETRESVDWKGIALGYVLDPSTGTYQWHGLDLAEEIAKSVCKDPLHPEVDCIRIDPNQTHETTESYVKDVQNVYYKFTDGSEFHTNAYCRKEMVILFNGTYTEATEEKTQEIELHVFWGREAFAKEYPLSVITNVVFPCNPCDLYHLLEIYGSVSKFATESSKYRTELIDRIIGSGDQTGVFNFATDYYAFPDTEPDNRFELTFGVVYKGAKPTLTAVRQAILDMIHLTDPEHHSDEEWARKLPGLFSEMRFFLIPIYDAIFSDKDAVEHRRGIVQLSRIENIVKTILPGEDFLKYKDHFSIIVPSWTHNEDGLNRPKYSVIAVAHPLNSADGNDDLATVYPDYIGTDWGTVESEKQSDATKIFNQGFDSALGRAIANQEGGTITEDGKKNVWVTFNVSTTQFFILTKGSWEEAFKDV